jgi:hypothetical protein
MIAGTILASTSGLTVGYVLWLLRGGALLSGFLSSMAAWQLADPLPVLAYASSSRRKDRKSDDSLEHLIADGKRAAKRKEQSYDQTAQA